MSHLVRYSPDTVIRCQQSVGEAAIRIARRWIEDAEHITEEDKAAWTEAAKTLRFPQVHTPSPLGLPSADPHLLHQVLGLDRQIDRD